MLHHTLLIVLLISLGHANHQQYPGTITRPVLSDVEAEIYTKEKYLNGWTPDKIETSKHDYLVGSGGFRTIQEAVNAAIVAGGTTRKYINVEKGIYRQAVLIPRTVTVPITIYGTQGKPDDVHLVLSQPNSMTGSDYAKQVNPNGTRYKPGDPAWHMFNYCSSRDTIGTPCSAVLYAENSLLEVAYMTVENPSKAGQAVAVCVEGDKVQLDHVWIYGFQDTLLVGGSGRSYFTKPTIKGDVDFIFGPATAVFENAQIIARGDRPRSSAIVFAPNTPNSRKYGFLLINSKITADSNIRAKNGCSLARAWDSSKEVNGQVVIRETEIVDVINQSAPYSIGAGGRPFAGNINKNRNLDDPKYNRFWEHNNTGAGA